MLFVARVCGSVGLSLVLTQVARGCWIVLVQRPRPSIVESGPASSREESLVQAMYMFETRIRSASVAGRVKYRQV